MNQPFKVSDIRLNSTSSQKTESLSPTILMLSLIFFSFSSTMTVSMGGMNWLRLSTM